MPLIYQKSVLTLYPSAVSKVALENLILPEREAPPFDNPELTEVADRIVAARKAGRPVIWMLGGHVVKRGLSPLLIDLMARGVMTHLASNGATTIHDFEIGLRGRPAKTLRAAWRTVLSVWLKRPDR